MLFALFYVLAITILVMHFTGFLARHNLEWLVLVLAASVFRKRPAAPPIVFSRGSAIFLLFGRENDGEKTRASVLAKAS